MTSTRQLNRTSLIKIYKQVLTNSNMNIDESKKLYKEYKEAYNKVDFHLIPNCQQMRAMIVLSEKNLIKISTL